MRRGKRSSQLHVWKSAHTCRISLISLESTETLIFMIGATTDNKSTVNATTRLGDKPVTLPKACPKKKKKNHKRHMAIPTDGLLLIYCQANHQTYNQPPSWGSHEYCSNGLRCSSQKSIPTQITNSQLQHMHPKRILLSNGVSTNNGGLSPTYV
jgi:diaminopimelate epimerase